ncbi:ASCH domain-containing protein [Salinigranum sp. GCM10025319]|uniref:ASCH domain-containing protein n=1 Tax=Salinigranum sp. GCM10025319 TaxID=3252687 RepID=UPI0036196120
MAHIDAGDLLPNERVERMAVDGDLTQLHRGDRYADEGDSFEIDGVRFVVTSVDERTLGDLTDADARAEGSADLAAYRRRLEAVHDSFEWDDDSPVVRHRFERRDGA